MKKLLLAVFPNLLISILVRTASKIPICVFKADCIKKNLRFIFLFLFLLLNGAYVKAQSTIDFNGLPGSTYASKRPDPNSGVVDVLNTPLTITSGSKQFDFVMVGYSNSTVYPEFFLQYAQPGNVDGSDDMFLYQQDAAAHVVSIKTHDASTFQFKSFQIADYIGQNFTVKGYLNNSPVTGASFTMFADGSIQTVSPPSSNTAFKVVDEIRITCDVGFGTEFDNFVWDYSVPGVTTGSAASVTANSATLTGSVTNAGLSAVTEKGVVWSTTASPTTANTKLVNGTGTGAISISATGLTASTTYHFRAYATNSAGTAYGDDQTFTTSVLAQSILFKDCYEGTPDAPTQNQSGITLTYNSSTKDYTNPDVKDPYLPGNYHYRLYYSVDRWKLDYINASAGNSNYYYNITSNSTTPPTSGPGATNGWKDIGVCNIGDATSLVLGNGTSTTASKVTGITSTTSNGTYGTGKNINLIVNFSDPVTVTGVPTLSLSSGGTANYISGSGTSALTFNYTVGNGNSASLLDYASTSALNLNGGTIKTGSTAATLTLPAPGAAGSLSASKSIVIDGIAPPAPIVAMPANSSTTNNALPGYSGTAEATLNVTVYVGGKSIGSTLTSSSGMWSLAQPTALPDGLYSVNAVATDQAGNAGPSSATNSFTVDGTPPTIVSITKTGTSPTNAASLGYTVIFSETVQNVDVTDFNPLYTTGTAKAASISFSGTGTTYSLTLNGVSGQGTLRLDLKSSGTGITDAAGNAITGGYTNGDIYTVDCIAPTVSISSTAGASGSASATTPLPFTVTFSESVTGFVAGDVTVANGNLTDFSGSGSTYTFNVVPATAGTATTVNVAAGVAQDALGNSNTAATPYSLTYTAPVGPVVTTATTTLVTTTSATLGGNVTADGGSSVTERGIVFVTGTGTPTTANNKVAVGSGTGTFSQTVTGLTPGTSYTVRAYAINNAGTSYGAVATFKTAAALKANISSQTNIACNGSAAGSVTVTATGGTAPYTYAWSNGATTATLTNVPAGVYKVTITDAADGTATASATITQPLALVITPAQTNVSASGGNTGSATATVSGGISPYSYSWSNKATTATISNLVEGTYTVTVTDAYGCTTTQNYTITQPAQPTITLNTNALTFSTCAGSSSAGQAVAVTGSNLTTGSVSISLPSGFQASLTQTGGYSGVAPTLTVATDGTISTTVYIRMAAAQSGSPGGSVKFSSGTATQSLTVSGTFNAVPGITLGTVTPVLSSATSFSIPYTGITGLPDVYSITTGSNAMSGFTTVSNARFGSSPILVNIPAETAAGTYNFNLTVANSATGCTSGSQSFSVTVNSPVPTITLAPSSLPGSTVAANYSQAITASGGTAPYSYTISSGALPAGITLTSNGLLSGTPTAGGTFKFTVTATDKGSYNGEQSYTLNVNAPTIALSSLNLPDGTYNTAYNQVFTATGGTAPYNYSVTGGALPAGLTLASDGSLSGTPTVTGTLNFTVTATDASTGAGPFTNSHAYTLVINKAQATLALNKLTQNYDGTPKPVTVATTPAGLNGISVTYDGSSVVPSAVGSYAVKATLNNTNYTAQDATGVLNIISVTPTITFAALPVKTYGDADFTPGATSDNTAASIIYASSNTAVATIVDGKIHIQGAGTATITAKQAAGGNYSAAKDQQQTLTVAPAYLTITADDQTKVYGEAQPALTTTYKGFVNGDTPSSLTTQPIRNTAATAGSSIGNYAITVSGAADPNYSITYVAGNLSVTPAAITVAANVQTKVYGQADPALTYQITSGALIGSDAFTGSLTRDAGEAPGTYTIRQGTFSSGSNYTLTYEGSSLTIDQAAQTITFASLSAKTYGDADFAPGATGNHATASITYASSNTAVATIVDGKVHIVGVGTANITASQAANADYAAANDVTRELTVAKAEISIAAAAKNKTYGEADPALTYTITSGSLKGSDGFTGTLSRNAGENVGTYSIKQGTLALNDNYRLTYNSANVNITPAPITVTGAAESKFYGDTDPALTYTFSPALVNGDSFSGSLTREPGENAGTYTIKQGSLVLNNNYTITYNGADFTIGAKAIAVTAAAQSKNYGDADPALTYTFSPALVNGDSFTGSLTREAGENAGTYTINQGTLALNGNYTLTYHSDKLTISQRLLTIAADPQSKLFGQADPVLTCQITSGALKTGDRFSGTLSRTAGENVGTYLINQGTLTAGSNYALNFTGSNLTIQPTVRTLTFNSLPTKNYGDGDFNAGASLNTGETVNYASSDPSVATIVNGRIHIVAAGSTIITASAPDNANYNFLVPVSQPLIVIKANQTINFASIPSLERSGKYDLSVVTSSAGLPVTFTVTDQTIASVQGTELTGLAIGTTTVTASAAGNRNYNDANAIVQTVRVTDPQGQQLLVRRDVSPNGDGIGDGLYIEGIKDYPNNNVTVVNRNGVKVFEAKNYDNVNDIFTGRSNVNGQLQTPGTYFYVVLWTDAQGVGHRKAGYFVLKYHN